MNIGINIKIFFVIAFLSFFAFDNLLAQWVNDPSANTKIVIDPVDPVNISAIKDMEGGAYIFWQDKKFNSSPDIYFLRINRNGEPGFRADGKSITTSGNIKEDPLTVSGPFGNAIVIWKEIDKKRESNLFIQKVSKNGLRLWGANGLQLTNSKLEKTDYSLRVDKKGYSYISFVSKSAQVFNRYLISYQKVDPNGRLLEDSTNGIIYTSNNIMSETEIVPDNKYGAFVFWLENVNQKTTLRCQHVDSSGSVTWNDKPITISKGNNRVINYSVGKLGKDIYVVITYQGTKKSVYQQLVSEKGKLLWGNDGKLITNQKGIQVNPQFIFVDSTVVVSWTNEFEKIKDVYVQRFDLKGNELWVKNGKKVINIVGNQFGQKLIYDNKGGVIIAWIDKKGTDVYANLTIQKIDLQGKLVWNPEGVNISSSEKMQKSYLNLVGDNEGGAIAVFRGNVNSKNDIYAQKIFSTGTYASQILGFSTEIVSDSIKVYWYAANEMVGTTYSIQRAEQTNGDSVNWKTVGQLKLENKKLASYYEFYDKPNRSGTIFYRIIQKNSGKVLQVSQQSSIDYFFDNDAVILGQNSPNPFTNSTNITFYLPEAETVTLEIFDDNIQVVKKIENKSYPAGKNTYVFDAAGLKPGVYYYRLRAQDFVDVKKMIITN